MENLTTEQPKSAEQILEGLGKQMWAKELRESLREMFFASLRSEWSNYMEDRTMYLTTFESLDEFLQNLEVYQDIVREQTLLEQESEKAERERRLDQKLQKFQEEQIKENVELKKKRQKLLARVESLKAQIEVWANEQDDD